MNDRHSRWSTQGLPKLCLHRAAIVAFLGSSIIVWLWSLNTLMPILRGHTAKFAWEVLVIEDEDVGWCGRSVLCCQCRVSIEPVN